MGLQKQILLILGLLSVCSLAQSSVQNPFLTEILCSVNFPTRPQFCLELYAPVCASYPRQCLIPPCPQYQDFSSNCFACQNPNVESYRPGACVFVCDADVPLAADQSFSPVCAISQEGCNDSSCRKSFRNSNIACQDASIISFTNGVCEGDVLEDQEEEEFFPEESFEGIIEEEGVLHDEETILVEDDEEESLNDFYLGILCNDPRPTACTRQYDPVCVIECADAACRRTASNACSACSDPNVLVYTPQSCEVERIECQPLDLSATNMACTDLWDPVCSYSRDCEGDSCGITSSNECYACTIQGADYYIRGECPGSSA